jgi:enamine deaminase RidA (YjgF/YER057c/UK114 family)
MNIEDKLKNMELSLPEPLVPIGNYVPAVRTDNILFLSGHGPRSGDKPVMTGKVGKDLTLEQGYEAAKLTVLNCLSTIKHEIGDLNKIKRIVKLFGMVNCPDNFSEHPKVINGASDLLVELFGESGKHARSAVGMQSLPMDIPVEIEMIVEVI